MLFDLDLVRQVYHEKTSTADWLKLILLLDSWCQVPCPGSPAPPWVAAASAYLWCHSSCELVNLWGKPLSLGMTLLFPPAPSSVLNVQHNFHCFASCTSWICFAKSLQYLLSRGKLSSVIKPCLEVWEAEFSVLLSHCFLCLWLSCWKSRTRRRRRN